MTFLVVRSVAVKECKILGVLFFFFWEEREDEVEDFVGETFVYLGMVLHTFDLSTRKVDAGGSKVQGQFLTIQGV